MSIDKVRSIEQGDRLKIARKLTMLSRRAFAKKYSFNSSSYQAWEDGKYKKGISIANAEKIIEALKQENIFCDMSWILHGSGQAAERRFKVNHNSRGSASYNMHEKTLKNKKIKGLNVKLIQAIKNNKVEAARQLVLEGANLHKLTNIELYMFDVKEFSALHYAAWYGGISLVKMFIDLGLKINIRNRFNETPMHLAANSGNKDVIKLLYQSGASIECANNEGTTPIMWASQTNQASTVEYLVSLGALVNETDFKGRTAAHWAAFHGNVEALNMLYKLGAYFDIENNEGKTPLDVAIINGHLDALNAILKTMENKS